jgi:hypothetical protein
VAVNLQNLDQRFPIVDPETGQPTDYFMRLLRGQTGELATITGNLEGDVTSLINRNINTGFGLSGGGSLTADRTISLGDPALVDPTADRILFWDDSEGQLQWLQAGSGLSISGTTLTAAGGGGGGNPSLLFSAAGPESNGATTGSAVLVHPFTVPANTLSSPGDYLDIEYFGQRVSSTSGVKAWNYQVGGSYITGGFSVTTASDGRFWMRFRLVYLDATNTYFLDQGRHLDNTTGFNGGAANYVNSFSNHSNTTNIDWSVDNVLGPLVTSNVANTMFVRFTSILLGKA